MDRWEPRSGQQLLPRSYPLAIHPARSSKHDLFFGEWEILCLAINQDGA